MSKTISTSQFLLISLLFSCGAYAESRHDMTLSSTSEYQTMHVSITNQSDSDCSRVNVYNPRGSLIEGSRIPLSINKGETAYFIMQEGTLTGPDVYVTYRCGKEAFRVRAWQSQCWLAYGCDSHGEIISKTPDMVVDEPVDVRNASRYYNLFGEVHFTVRNKS